MLHQLLIHQINKRYNHYIFLFCKNFTLQIKLLKKKKKNKFFKIFKYKYLIFVENDVEKLKDEIKNDNIERMIEMFKAVFNEEQFHENEKKEMFEQGIEQGQKENRIDITNLTKEQSIIF